MYTKQPKKLAIVNILDILKRYTDEDHRLSQKDIQDVLERKYYLICSNHKYDTVGNYRVDRMTDM